MRWRIPSRTWHQINGDKAQGKKIECRIVVLKHLAVIRFFLASTDEKLLPRYYSLSIAMEKTNSVAANPATLSGMVDFVLFAITRWNFPIVTFCCVAGDDALR